MIAIVKQGKSEAKVEVGDAGISFADVICQALGYGQIELESVVFVPHPNGAEEPSRGNFQIGYNVGKAFVIAQVHFEAGL